MSCCSHEPAPKPSCHHEHTEKPSNTPTPSCCETKAKVDYWLWGSLALVAVLYGLHFVPVPWGWLHTAAHGVFELLNTMAWGVAVGVVMVAVLAYVPREWVMHVMGTNTGLRGIGRATAAGVLLDLCSHGILMVGAKLYERGASLGQVMAFLIASPWNSFSLTLIMIALIGLSWTFTFIALSLVIAFIAGLLFDALVKRGVLPPNPNTQAVDSDFQLLPAMKQSAKNFKPSLKGTAQFIKTGIQESRMVIRWLLIGVLLAAAIRAFVPPDVFGNYFGPTALGLLVTMLVATVLEVCSEGSTPIAADIFNKAGAPGNSFAFLMAGVATDYTEIMVIKSATRSWRIALFLPLLVLPQVVLIALLINASLA